MPDLPTAAKKVSVASLGLHKVLERNQLMRETIPKVQLFFKDQKEIALAELEVLRPVFESKLQGPKGLLKDELAAWDRIWEQIDSQTFNKLKLLIEETEQLGLLKGGKVMENAINPTGQFWDVENPRAVAWFKENGGSLQYIKNIQGTTKDQLQTIITRAIDEGIPYTKTAKEISDTFDEFGRQRARNIAVYEIGNAYEAGNRMFADQIAADGVIMEKRWAATEDERECEVCQQNVMDGWIPIDQPHSSGHQQPQAHQACRCYEEYREAPD